MLRVQKIYRNGGSWHDVTLEDAIAQSEVLGFYKRGTVEMLLARGERVRTPYADFRAVKPAKKTKK